MNPAPAHFNATIKPVGAACNLACGYCFYRADGQSGSPMMDEATLDRVLAKLFAVHAEGLVTITWQGGEPTLRGLEFFRRAFAEARRLARPGQTVRHAFQTNGPRIDAGWAGLFREEGVLVGLSCDGPPELHDRWRHGAAGQASSAAVEAAWRLLGDQGVETNILCTVNPANAAEPLATYRYLRDRLGARHIQFLPLVRPIAGIADPDGPYPGQFGDFLLEVYGEWVRSDIGAVSVQAFEAVLATVLGLPSVCVFMPECGACPIIEADGSLRACDHFASDEWVMPDYSALGAFGRRKAELEPACLRCDVRRFCNGGCPAGRLPKTRSQSVAGGGRHWLCEAWRGFFRRAEGDMEWMARQLRRGGQPSRLMQRHRTCPPGN